MPYCSTSASGTSCTAMTEPPCCSNTSTICFETGTSASDHVVREHQHERLVADDVLRLQHGVADALLLRLADVHDVREVADALDLVRAARGRPSRAASSPARSERSKWSSTARLLAAVTMKIWVIPAAAASSTVYWMMGLSTSGSDSLGWALVAGSIRVPYPAARTTAFRTGKRALPSNDCAVIVSARRTRRWM